MAADPTYQPGAQIRQDGNIAVPTGHWIDIETGGMIKVAGSDVTATANGAGVAGVASGYLLARGETALDGSNPTPVVTGLTTIIAFVCTLKGSAAPGVGTSSLTFTFTGGTASVYAWKVTATGDCTLIASTGTETFDWIAVGV